MVAACTLELICPAEVLAAPMLRMIAYATSRDRSSPATPV
jgi:hypothetical protein